MVPAGAASPASSASAPEQVEAQAQLAEAEDGVPPEQEQSAPASKPALVAVPPVAMPSVARRPVAPSQPAVRSAAADMKALEGQPGATPALPAGTVPAGKKHPEIAGTPGESPAVGPADAKVQVYVFSDFQCPVCRRVVEPLKQLHRDFPDSVQVVWKHNALEMHKNAAGAAAATIAAQRQGKFWEYHDRLFANQRNLERPALIAHARELGLDTAKFEKDLDDPAVAAQIVYERNLATALGARGTPGFFVNGQKLVGWGSYGGFKSMVGRALKAAKELEASGTPADQVRVKATQAAGESGKAFAKYVYHAP